LSAIGVKQTLRRRARAYRAPLRQALIDNNSGFVNVVGCAAGYEALKSHLTTPIVPAMPSSVGNTQRSSQSIWF
jgi:hypothetical protein